MDVWVLIGEGGYDGEAFLGVYSSEEAALEAEADFRKRTRPEQIGWDTYTRCCAVDAPAEWHSALDAAN